MWNVNAKGGTECEDGHHDMQSWQGVPEDQQGQSEKINDGMWLTEPGDRPGRLMPANFL